METDAYLVKCFFFAWCSFADTGVMRLSVGETMDGLLRAKINQKSFQSLTTHPQGFTHLPLAIFFAKSARAPAPGAVAPLLVAPRGACDEATAVD